MSDKSHFFAHLARLKLINRWPLMHNVRTENVQEHSLQVAMVAHALALIKNKFFNDVEALYKTAPTPEQLKELLGRARAKKGMFEGDLDEGELEIGQISGLIHDIKPVAEIVKEMVDEFEKAKKDVANF